MQMSTRMPSRMLCPRSGTTRAYCDAQVVRDQNAFDEGREHEQPEEPPDDGRNGGHDADERLDQPGEPDAARARRRRSRRAARTGGRPGSPRPSSAASRRSRARHAARGYGHAGRMPGGGVAELAVEPGIVLVAEVGEAVRLEGGPGAPEDVARRRSRGSSTETAASEAKTACASRSARSDVLARRVGGRVGSASVSSVRSGSTYTAITVHWRCLREDPLDVFGDWPAGLAVGHEIEIVQVGVAAGGGVARRRRDSVDRRRL